MKNIGWIGTGVMGAPMCGHLLAAGHSVRVYNRTPAKAEPLAAKGAILCNSAREAVGGCDVVFAIVGFPRDVEEVILGEDGALAGLPQGGIIVDMTTSEPSLAIRIADEAARKGVRAIDAPVSGGDIGAREGTLAIMAGGERRAFDDVLPLLQLMGKTVAYMGPAGAGQHTKMCNQILIASTMLGVVESLLYAQKAGLGREQVIGIIGNGAAASWSINNLGRRIADGNFEPGFYIKHFVKDMGIALREAAAMRLELPGLALVHRFYESAMDMGFENLGTQALYNVLRQTSEREES